MLRLRQSKVSWSVVKFGILSAIRHSTRKGRTALPTYRLASGKISWTINKKSLDRPLLI